MKTLFRRATLAVGACFCGLPLLAQDASTAIDITPATDVLDAMKDALNSFWESAEPFIITVVGLVVVAALIWAGVRLFKGGASKVSGR